MLFSYLSSSSSRKRERTPSATYRINQACSLLPHLNSFQFQMNILYLSVNSENTRLNVGTDKGFILYRLEALLPVEKNEGCFYFLFTKNPLMLTLENFVSFWLSLPPNFPQRTHLPEQQLTPLACKYHCQISKAELRLSNHCKLLCFSLLEAQSQRSKRTPSVFGIARTIVTILPRLIALLLSEG